MSEEKRKISPEDYEELQFIQYISILANGAMQQMGKLMNPLSGKMEKNLAAAKATIDLIGVLKKKTKGNLTANEEDIISSALANLQLNYADEVKRMEKEGEK